MDLHAHPWEGRRGEAVRTCGHATCNDKGRHRVRGTMPKKKTHKKRFAAPKFVANADELENRNNEMEAQKAARRGRRIAAGCDDDDLKDDIAQINNTEGDDGFLGVAADMARLKMEQEEALDGTDSQVTKGRKKKSSYN